MNSIEDMAFERNPKLFPFLRQNAKISIFTNSGNHTDEKENNLTHFREFVWTFKCKMRWNRQKTRVGYGILIALRLLIDILYAYHLQSKIFVRIINIFLGEASEEDGICQATVQLCPFCHQDYRQFCTEFHGFRISGWHWIIDSWFPFPLLF